MSYLCSHFIKLPLKLIGFVSRSVCLAANSFLVIFSRATMGRKLQLQPYLTKNTLLVKDRTVDNTYPNPVCLCSERSTVEFTPKEVYIRLQPHQ